MKGQTTKQPSNAASSGSGIREPRLMPRQREPRLMQFRRGRVELLTACPRGADLNPKHSPDRHHSNASHRLANEAKRREPKSGRIPGEQILSSTDAFIRAESWTNLGPNSAYRILKGLGSSNPPLSATDSLSLGEYLARISQIVLRVGHWQLTSHRIRVSTTLLLTAWNGRESTKLTNKHVNI